MDEAANSLANFNEGAIMDDPRYGTPLVSRFGWLQVFSRLAQLCGQPRVQLQPLHVGQRPQQSPQPQAESEDWGDLWSTVHW